jgi:hypothetical protein
MNYTFQYQLTTGIYNQQPGGTDMATEDLTIYAYFGGVNQPLGVGGTTQELTDIPISGTQSTPTVIVPGTFNLDLPANSTQYVGYYAWLFGTASSQIPEPSSLALVGIGAISLLAYGWRRRKAKT